MDDISVLYINWDGFAYYYYEEAHRLGLVPVIDRLRAEGSFFENARCGVPPITNPMQTAISSGVYSSGTGNVKLYYDKALRTVVSQRRENKAENIVQALARQGVSVASVHHFTFEENGCSASDPERPFIFIEQSNYLARFRELLRLYKGETVHLNGETRHVTTAAPRFVAAYFDDLDTIGHNNGKLAPVAQSQEQRMKNVLWRLHQMDEALGEFIEGLKAAKINDRIALFLITDHGMTPFLFNKKAAAAYEDFLGVPATFGLKCKVLLSGQTPRDDTDIVVCSAGLSLMLSYLSPAAQDMAGALVDAFQKKPYIGRMMTADELVKTGAFPFCDLYVSPRPPYILRRKAIPVGANHDSLEESARHIFSLAAGNGIRRGALINRRVDNIDFAPTMAALLGAEPPRQNVGKIIRECMDID